MINDIKIVDRSQGMQLKENKIKNKTKLWNNYSLVAEKSKKLDKKLC